MATEVKHGLKPKFRVKLQGSDPYGIAVTGYYTVKDQMAAAGMTDVVFQSKQEDKRRAELLALRSAFIGGWMELWIAHGGGLAEGVEAFTRYPFSRIFRGLITRKWWRRP